MIEKKGKQNTTDFRLKWEKFLSNFDISVKNILLGLKFSLHWLLDMGYAIGIVKMEFKFWACHTHKAQWCIL